MRKLIFALAFAFAANWSFAEMGPRTNPDDQFRLFWLYPFEYYPELVASGFNLFMNDCFGAYSVESGRFDPKSVAARKRSMDRILADGCDYMEQLAIPQHKTFVAKYPRILKDGSELRRNADMGWDVAMAAALKGARAAAESIGRHPACVGIEPSSEVRDGSCPSSREYFARKYREATGEEVPPEVENGRVAPHYLRISDFPASRVVDEDYRLMKFYRWFWKTGDGWNDYQSGVRDVFVQTLGRPLLSMYDPIVRTPPLWGSGGDLTHNNQWTYPTPEPYNVHYVISEQQAMARGVRGQKVMSMVQGISYRSRLAPKDVKVANEPAWVKDRPNAVYITTPPDVMREALWACFAHQMDGIGVFAWRALFDASSPRMGKAARDRNAVGYQFTNPETIHAISNVFHTVGIPLGPLFRAIPERDPEVAVLESYASTFFANRGSWGWDGAIFQFGTTADAANLQPYVIYEEEIARDGIPPTVKVICAPHCDVLTRTTFEALRAFQRNGGLIVGDEHLVPGILPDITVKQFRRTWKDGAGDAAALRRDAAGLKASLAPFYRPPADSDNEHLITFVRTYRSSDYLFVLNDRRTFGDYVGQWKMVMEKGCPNAGKVTLRRTAGAVYDLVRHVRIPHRILPNGDTEVSLEFATNDGKCLLFSERPLGKLSVDVSGRRIRVHGEDCDVLMPIEIRVGGQTRYAVVRDGAYEWDCLHPLDRGVQVVNLADGTAITAAPKNVLSFGAKGDGVTDDTASIQRSLDETGSAVFPTGTYLTGTLHLRSNGGLAFEKGAKLLATTDPERWNRRDFCPQNLAYQPDWASGAHLICAVGVTNVFIRGGVIDGNGRKFFTDRFHLACCGRKQLDEGPFRPRQMLYFCESANISLDDVRLENSAYWNCFLHGCEDVDIRNCVIRSAEEIGENDGIDIDCCRNVRVSDCDIEVGDDGVTCRANFRGLANGRSVCEDVLVTNCAIRSFYAHAIRIGVGEGEIRNCAFRGLMLPKTRGGIWLCSKYGGKSRGAQIHDIDFDNIELEAGCWLFAQNEYRFTKPGDPLFTGRLDGIRFRNVRGTSDMPRSVRGNGVAKPIGLSFENCSVTERRTALADQNEREFFLYKEQGAQP